MDMEFVTLMIPHDTTKEGLAGAALAFDMIYEIRCLEDDCIACEHREGHSLRYVNDYTQTYRFKSSIECPMELL